MSAVNIITKCSQESCTAQATHSYVWPGKPDRMFACERHMGAARGLGDAMGFQLGDVQELNPDPEALPIEAGAPPATTPSSTQEIRSTLLRALSVAQGDDLERAEAHFRGWTPERMARPWSGNGESAQQVLDGYREHRAQITNAIAWVEANCR